jgi:hypothetical protein
MTCWIISAAEEANEMLVTANAVNTRAIVTRANEA